jgi:hypothetical protein
MRTNRWVVLLAGLAIAVVTVIARAQVPNVVAGDFAGVLRSATGTPIDVSTGNTNISGTLASVQSNYITVRTQAGADFNIPFTSISYTARERGARGMSIALR